MTFRSYKSKKIICKFSDVATLPEQCMPADRNNNAANPGFEGFRNPVSVEDSFKRRVTGDGMRGMELMAKKEGPCNNHCV